MLNARLNNPTQTANPPLESFRSSQRPRISLISKTKDAFTGIVANKEDGIDSCNNRHCT